MRKLMYSTALLCVAFLAATSQPGGANVPPDDDVRRWAEAFDVGAYGVAGSGFGLEYGLAYRLDEPGVYTSDGVVPDGIWYVAVGVSPCGVLLEDELLQVGGPESDGGLTSITCGAGWYACCYCEQHNGHKCPVARCRKNGTKEPNGGCQAGGPGAVSCTITNGACP